MEKVIELFQITPFQWVVDELYDPKKELFQQRGNRPETQARKLMRC